jgi:hypothetical protein
MTKILNQWGLGPLLERYGHRCTQFVFQKGKPRTRRPFQIDMHIKHPLGNNGDLLGTVKLHEQFLLQLMADFIFIQVRNVRAWITSHDDVLC